MAGRPTKLTPAVQEIIVAALVAGHYAEIAAELAGIDESTFYDWIKRGEGAKAREPYAAFAKAIKAAAAQAEQDALATARKGSTGAGLNPAPQWQSAMTFLERRYPQRWAKRDPDHGLKTKLLEAELKTLKAKLKLLEAGQNPDAQVINVHLPEALRREGE